MLQLPVSDPVQLHHYEKSLLKMSRWRFVFSWHFKGHTGHGGRTKHKFVPGETVEWWFHIVQHSHSCKQSPSLLHFQLTNERTILAVKISELPLDSIVLSFSREITVSDGKGQASNVGGERVILIYLKKKKKPFTVITKNKDRQQALRHFFFPCLFCYINTPLHKSKTAGS